MILFKSIDTLGNEIPCEEEHQPSALWEYWSTKRKNKSSPQTKCLQCRAESKEEGIHSSRTFSCTWQISLMPIDCRVSNCNLMRIFYFCRTGASCCTNEKKFQRRLVFVRRNLSKSAQVLSTRYKSTEVIFAEFTSFRYCTMNFLDVCSQ